MAKVNTSGVDRIKDKLLQAKINAQRAVVRETFLAARANTPVRTGYLKNNWQITFDAPATEPIDNRNTSPQQLAKLSWTARDRMRLIYVTNAAPYAKWVEYGTSRFAGRLMLTRAVASVKSRMNQIIAKAFKEAGL